MSHSQTRLIYINLKTLIFIPSPWEKQIKTQEGSWRSSGGWQMNHFGSNACSYEQSSDLNPWTWERSPSEGLGGKETKMLLVSRPHTNPWKLPAQFHKTNLIWSSPSVLAISPCVHAPGQHGSSRVRVIIDTVCAHLYCMPGAWMRCLACLPKWARVVGAHLEPSATSWWPFQLKVMASIIASKHANLWILLFAEQRCAKS